MSQYSVTAETCTDIIQQMSGILGATSPNRKRTRYGGLSALLSPMNMTGRVDVQYDQGGGFHRDVDVWYYQRAVDADILDAIPSTCETTEEYLPCKQDFTVAQKAAFGFRIRSDEIAKLCGEGVTTHFQRGMMLNMEAFLRRINSDVLTSLQAGVGTNIATGLSTTTTIDIYDDATGQVNAVAWQAFMEQIEDDNQFNSMPIVIGQGGFSRANRMFQFGCCNDDGLDFAAIQQLSTSAGYSYFKDQQIDTVIGANRAIVMEPGSAQFVPYLKYADTNGAGSVITGNSDAYGSFQLDDGHARGVFRDDVTGLVFDMKISPDNCADILYVFGELCYDIWTPPTDLTKVGDHLEGANGLYDYTFT